MEDAKDDTTVKIGCRVPAKLWDNVQALGYTSQTRAIVAGLELILKASSEPTEGDENATQTDKVEIAVLRARNEELEKHNVTLIHELGMIEDFHSHYMMQMQTLINQKAIETKEKKKWWEIWK